MAKEIFGVEPGSPGAKAGIIKGDVLVSAGGHSINDVLDYKFYTYEPAVSLRIERGGKPLDIKVKKPEGMDLGLSFETYLMDEQKGCGNKCVFCFIDQLPKGLRRTLYFKDDDARLSFLIGNYITLTNLSDEDVKRIVQMKVSPLNISVHTLNPGLRSLMLGNKRGGESLKYLYDFARSGISINAQIVVCPGLNDGEELKGTLEGLSRLYPAVKSVAVVPVGVTKHRGGLYPLKPMDAKCAGGCIDIIDEVRRQNLASLGDAVCHAADEMYLKAGRALPGGEYYGDFDQLENGVGLMELFRQELSSAVEFEEHIKAPAPFGIVCGTAIAAFMADMVDMIASKCDNLTCEILPVVNNFFGDTVDVSGLVTGGDIIAQLKGKTLPRRLIIPDVMLRHGENVFLDGSTVKDIEGALGVKVKVCPVDGGDFLDMIVYGAE